jgi:hypothetical protein
MERATVIEAYEQACSAGKDALGCYLAAVDALQRNFPEARRSVIANEAIRILTADISFVDLAKDPGSPAR